MAIANEKIFLQIQKECERALQKQGSAREHARAIQALTNLLLEESMEQPQPTISDVEWQSMVGKKQSSPTQLIEKRLKEEDGNGDSLLDF